MTLCFSCSQAEGLRTGSAGDEPIVFAMPSQAEGLRAGSARDAVPRKRPRVSGRALRALLRSSLPLNFLMVFFFAEKQRKQRLFALLLGCYALLRNAFGEEEPALCARNPAGCAHRAQ